MGNIAIIGTEGSGKTVLLTALAKAFELPSRSGVVLEAINRQTAEYVDVAWSQLSNGAWPKGTEPGVNWKLRWRLRRSNESIDEVGAIDPAGADVRSLFDDDQDSNDAQLRSSQRELLQFLRTADILVFLLNMRDFLGEPDQTRRRSNEWTLKRAMDVLVKRRHSGRQQYCLVFTQMDLYPDAFSPAEQPKDFMRKNLPKVYAAHFQDHDMPVLPVAAVNKTKVAVLSGKPQRVPANDFSSTGVDQLGEWLGSTLAALQRPAMASRESTPLRTPRKESPPRDEHKPHPAWTVAAIAVSLWFLLRGCGGGSSLHTPPPAPDQKRGAVERRSLDAQSVRALSHPVKGRDLSAVRSTMRRRSVTSSVAIVTANLDT
jgi:hypothetical protein